MFSLKFRCARRRQPRSVLYMCTGPGWDRNKKLVREGAQKSNLSPQYTYAPAHVYAFARRHVPIYTSTHLRPNGTRHPGYTPTRVNAKVLRPYTRRRVGFAIFFIFEIFTIFAIFVIFVIFARIPLNIAPQAKIFCSYTPKYRIFAKSDVACAPRARAWEEQPLGAEIPYTDLHTHLVRLKFRLPQNAFALL